MRIITFVEQVIQSFRAVFSREATFNWFVIVFWSLMLRMDTAGVTSIVRCMGLDPNCYLCLLHFFHSSAFSVKALCISWRDILHQYAQPVCLNTSPLYVVDGIKVGKAGKKMPGVKLLYQESEDNTKPEYIMGHFWGALSLLVHCPRHVFSLPVRFQIQDGLKRSPTEVATLIDKMGTLVIETIGQAIGIVVADAYYSTRGFLSSLDAVGLHYIGKVKSNTVAYLLPVPSTGPRRRGRPRKYGDRIRLKDLFKQPRLFTSARISLYGEQKLVRYHAVDLLWQAVHVRFVLTILPDGARAILLCTDRSLTAEQIIWAYSLRQKIEVSFQALVHLLCAFCYHFWMQAMPKLKRGSSDQYLHRASEDFRRQVFRKIEAYERFVNISAIALGTLQLVAIHFTTLIWSRFPVWFRTLTKHGCPSEHVVRLTLQHELHQIFLETNDSTLLAKILAQKSTRDFPAHPFKIAA
jgi:hypothetical protein